MTSAQDALGVRLPAPGWAVLDAVRLHAFTGELTLVGVPPVRLWADRGRIYYAEPLDAPPLAARLLAAGALTHGELARGVVRVLDREHLGALFERAPGADRHAVLLAVARFTEDALRSVAAQQLAAAEITPYAFDPAGVHAWGDGGGPASTAAGATPSTSTAAGFAAPPADAVPAAAPVGPEGFPAPSPAEHATRPAAPVGAPLAAPPATAPAAGDDWEHLPYLDRLATEPATRVVRDREAEARETGSRESDVRPADVAGVEVRGAEVRDARETRAPEAFAVIWPDGDVERRTGAHGTVGSNGTAAEGTSPLAGVPVGTRTRLLDDRFGAL